MTRNEQRAPLMAEREELLAKKYGNDGPLTVAEAQRLSDVRRYLYAIDEAEEEDFARLKAVLKVKCEDLRARGIEPLAFIRKALR